MSVCLIIVCYQEIDSDRSTSYDGQAEVESLELKLRLSNAQNAEKQVKHGTCDVCCQPTDCDHLVMIIILLINLLRDLSCLFLPALREDMSNEPTSVEHCNSQRPMHPCS
jgi:hypothetical protein